MKKIFPVIILIVLILSGCNMFQPAGQILPDNNQTSKVSNQMQPFSIKDIQIASIPGDSVIVDINTSQYNRMKNLEKTGLLIITKGSAFGGLVDLAGNFALAEEDAYRQLSSFISTKVFSAMSRIQSSTGTNIKDSFNSVETAISNNQLRGALVVGRYYQNRPNSPTRDYFVFLFYDPSLFAQLLSTNADIVNELKNKGVSVDDFINAFNLEVKGE